MSVTAEPLTIEKVCSRCEQTKSSAEFHRDARYRDGLSSYCAQCQREYARAHHACNRAASQQREAERYLRDRDAILTRQKTRYADDPAARRAYIAQWARDNVDRRRAARQRRRARQRDAFVEDVHPLVVLERADGTCGICHGDVDPFDFHVDHVVPLSAGGEHSYANTQVAHPVCNLRKSTTL